MPRSAAPWRAGGADRRGSRYLGLEARSRRTRRRPAAGAGRAQGPADEGGPDHARPSRTPCPREYAAELAQLQSQRPADGQAVRPAPHGGRARAGLAEAFQGVSPWRPRPPPRWARCTRPPSTTADSSPASCNIPTWKRRSRPTCAAPADLHDLCSGRTIRRSTPAEIHTRDLGPAAGGARLRAGGPAYGALPPHAGRREPRPRAGAWCPSCRPGAC